MDKSDRLSDFPLAVLNFVCLYGIIPYVKVNYAKQKKGGYAVSFYTAVIVLVLMSLTILTIMVHGNDKIDRKDRQVLYVTYGLIAVSAIAEWMGTRADGDPTVSVLAIRFIKCIDFITAPLAGRLLVRQLNIKNVILKIMTVLLILNTAFQVVSLFTDWMITVDPKTHVYDYGNFYWIFILACAIVAMLVIAQFMVYGKAYKKSNNLSLYAVLTMVLCGMIFQELIPGREIRTSYIAIVFGL
ncbi:MAG: hypothetical protein J5766_04070, partial [Clostridia bacterium]|nr:hypothetical protein [Clostridia bacterium]